MSEELPKEWDLYGAAISIVSGANMASKEEIQEEIKAIRSIIDTGYYDDPDGNLLLKQVLLYLLSKVQ